MVANKNKIFEQMDLTAKNYVSKAEFVEYLRLRNIPEEVIPTPTAEAIFDKFADNEKLASD